MLAAATEPPEPAGLAHPGRCRSRGAVRAPVPPGRSGRGAAAGGLGVYTGTVRDRDGRLAALLAQEMLLRMHSPDELEQLAEIVELRRRSAPRRKGR